jgi:hypothetical protein
MTDNRLFIISALLLVGLTVLGTALQNRNTPAAAPAAVQTKSTPAATPTTAKSQTVTPAAKPQIRGYNGGEYGDD